MFRSDQFHSIKNNPFIKHTNISIQQIVDIAKETFIINENYFKACYNMLYRLPNIEDMPLEQEFSVKENARAPSEAHTNKAHK